MSDTYEVTVLPRAIDVGTKTTKREIIGFYNQLADRIKAMDGKVLDADKRIWQANAERQAAEDTATRATDERDEARARCAELERELEDMRHHMDNRNELIQSLEEDTKELSIANRTLEDLIISMARGVALAAQWLEARHWWVRRCLAFCAAPGQP